MLNLDIVEPLIAFVVAALSVVFWLIKQSLVLVEQRLKRLEEFEKTGSEAFKLLGEIKAKVDILINAGKLKPIKNCKKFKK